MMIAARVIAPGITNALEARSNVNVTPIAEPSISASHHGAQSRLGRQGTEAGSSGRELTSNVL
jgi:hypothetical protein